MSNRTECSKSSLKKKIERFISQGRSRFYFREMVEEVHISVRDVEDFLVPLLEEGKFEGSLEMRCPDCGADLGTFKKFNEIPLEIECEICGHKFPRSDEYLNIVLEVKDKFFRAQKTSSSPHTKRTDQT